MPRGDGLLGADDGERAEAEALEQAKKDEARASRKGSKRGRTGTAGAGAAADASALASLERQHGGSIKLGLLEKMAERAPRHTGRDDRATVDLVLDPRTRLILFRLVSQGVVGTVYGCISAGKEANVYYADKGPSADTHESVMSDNGGRAAESDGAVAPHGFALKVYKTSILVFKDRDRYVTGEYRFRSGYSKKNPRKMVRVWAEKEIRNLRRLRAAGILCPAPRLLRGHVLVMDFLGDDGWPAPRLRDAGLTSSKQASAYSQVVRAMRAMWERCRLVHADLSEYNLLWHDGKVVVIDVSQSVESDHPRAMDFLRMDCTNVTSYFGRRCGLRVMTPRELFDFVTHAGLTDEAAEEAYLAEVWKSVQSRKGGQVFASEEEEAEHNVFMKAFIPRSLADVDDEEAELGRVERGEASFTEAMVGPHAEAEEEAAAEEEASQAAPAASASASAAPAPSPPAAATRAADAETPATAAVPPHAAPAEPPRAVRFARHLETGPTPDGEARSSAELSASPADAAAGAPAPLDTRLDDAPTPGRDAPAPVHRNASTQLRADLLYEAPTPSEILAAQEAAELIGLDTTFLPGFGRLAIEHLELEYTAGGRRAAAEARAEEEEDAAAAEAASEGGDTEGKDEEASFTLRSSTKEERKAHKLAVKTAAREQRLTKVKKAAKRRRERTGARAAKG